MTRDDAIRYLEYLINGTRIEEYRKALSMAVAALREQEYRRWIPVAERLPELDEGVLVIASGKPHKNITLDDAFEIANYSDDCGWILDSWPEWETPDVTYWMPLPEPPKEEK